ncbi:MAG: DNA helicase II [Methylococcales bacterium]|nr:DNA helicase II [Methylococcales bacterium]
MDVSAIINPLNDAQRLAVSAPQQAILVLAGAGSGKTRVLVHRIAWQMRINHIPPQNILAVTFTNKAAREMRGRIEDLLNISTRSMWIGTFHGLAHRLLRQHAKQARLPETFQVMDSDDQSRIVKRLVKTMNIDDSKWPPKQLQWYINAQKEEGVRARHISDHGDPYQRQMLAVYKAYEELCERSGLVDFAELLLRAHELLRDNRELLDFYRERFRQVHVDEFQDTNSIQYAWLRLLTDGNNNLFVVGDDDQSIYGWRGAKIENIFNFRQHYPDHQVVRLERNYRSTGHILKAANTLIAHNDSRMGKELWTEAGEGEPISLYTAFNEQDEAYFVVEKIRQWIKDGGLRSDIAILYRSNAQSRQFEERLMTTAVPYRVYGGLRFFDRLEIKNALAYLRLASNPHDDASFERIVNTPTRGIGAKTLDEMRGQARQQQRSLWQTAQGMLEQRLLSPRAAGALQGFLNLIVRLGQNCADMALHDLIQQVIESSGLLEFYKNEKQDRNEARVENLEELVNAARLFDFDSLSQEDGETVSELDIFLTHAALEAGESQAEPEQDCVQLMTLHSAKGLEFKLVFMVGMEDGLFPSLQSLDDIGRLQEERRLCYVGITRAMQQLFLTHAESRRLYGKDSYPRPSRFLREIPADTLQEIRMRASITRTPGMEPTRQTALSGGGRYRPGQSVGHEKFGEGVVLQTEGEGDQERVQINFRHAGIKWLMLAYAKLEMLG